MSSKLKERHIRKLTIYASYLKRGSEYCRVPYIRLSGIWLIDAGFNISDKIKVIISKKSISIVVDKSESSDKILL